MYGPKKDETKVKFLMKDMLLKDEVVLKKITGRGMTDHMLSVTQLVVTDKRVLFYSQEKTSKEKEAFSFDKIQSISKVSGFDKIMANWEGISIELANGQKRTLRVSTMQKKSDLLNSAIYEIESRK